MSSGERHKDKMYYLHNITGVLHFRFYCEQLQFSISPYSLYQDSLYLDFWSDILIFVNQARARLTSSTIFPWMTWWVLSNGTLVSRCFCAIVHVNPMSLSLLFLVNAHRRSRSVQSAARQASPVPMIPSPPSQPSPTHQTPRDVH